MHLQPPARSAFDLLDWLLTRHVHEYFDTAGRPVGEGRALAFYEVTTELRVCPYAGSRHQHAKPMNLSALQEMAPWPHVLEMLAWLSLRYRERFERGVISPDDFAQVTSAGVFLADYVVLRNQQPLMSREIPTLISSVYKVCLGFQLAFLPDAAEPTVLPQATGFLALVEEAGLLIGESEVCAGSPAMIMQAYDAIIDKRGAMLAPPLQVDWPRFDQFAQGAAMVWREMVRWVADLPALMPVLSDARLPGEVQAHLNGLLKARTAELLEEQTGLVVEVGRAVREAGGVTPKVATVPSPRAGELSRAVSGWLLGAAPQGYETVIEEALAVAFSPYQHYEERVLVRLNGNLRLTFDALELDTPFEPVNATALSQICGKTFRDWLTS